MRWMVEFLDASGLCALEAFSPDARVRFERMVYVIEAVGLEKVHEPDIKHPKDRLWEMRPKRRPGITWAIDMTAVGRRIVVVRVLGRNHRKRQGPKEYWCANARRRFDEG